MIKCYNENDKKSQISPYESTLFRSEPYCGKSYNQSKERKIKKGDSIFFVRMIITIEDAKRICGNRKYRLDKPIFMDVYI